MRLSLIASLAALGVSAASDNFDDDDLNFLRLLSSNASSNATMAPTTVAAVNTTVAPANTTVAPANTTVAPVATTVPPAANTTVAPMNTTVAPMNTTVAPVATTVASGNATTAAAGDATTVAAGDATTVAQEATTAASGGDDTTAAAEATTVAQEATTAVSGGDGATPVATTSAAMVGGTITAENLCTAATYTMWGLTPPEISATTEVIGMTCTNGNLTFTSAAQSAYFIGKLAVTEENQKKCTDNGGTFTKLACGDGDHQTGTIAWFNSDSTEAKMKMAALGLCCGYPTGFESKSLDVATNGGKLYNAGTFTIGEYSDSDCATPKDTVSFMVKELYGDTMELTWTIGSCIGPQGFSSGMESGYSRKIVAANGTDGTGSILAVHYFDDGCAHVIESDIHPLHGCQVESENRRKLQGDNATSAPGATYEKMTVAGSGAGVSELQIVSDSKLTFTDLPDFVDAEKVAFVDATANTILEAVKAAAAEGTSTIKSKYGTGKLALTSTRRRLSKRRQLAGHESEVFVVTETLVPVAKANDMKQALEDAKTNNGGLSQQALGDAVVDAVKADATLTSKVGNLTAPTVVVGVAEPTIPVSTPGGGGGGGSTSGATHEYLGFAAGAVLFASALIL